MVSPVLQKVFLVISLFLFWSGTAVLKPIDHVSATDAVRGAKIAISGRTGDMRR